MTPTLQLRSIHLQVSDLARSVDFYARQVGFVVVRYSTDRVDLSLPGALPGGEPLLVLTENRSAPPASPAAAGLFHAALLLPDRSTLGHWLRAAKAAGVGFTGFSDHGVSEAIYFADPDGNGLEFYRDRPRESWPREHGELAMNTEPMDLPGVLAAADPARAPEPALMGARWGHFHFRVTNLDRSEKFYSEALGVTLTQRYGSSARFLAADGYHHHIGLNTWGQPRRPHSGAALGLVEVAFARRNVAEPPILRDPDGIALKITDLP